MSYFDKQVMERLTERLNSAGRAGAAACVEAGRHAREFARTIRAFARTIPVPSMPVPAPLRAAGAFIGDTWLIRSIGKETRFWVSLAIVVAALLSSVATFLILNGLTPIVPTNNVVLGSLGLSAGLVLVIIGIVGFQVVKLLRARYRQAAGAGLHFQIAGVFSLVALFPAILLATFATVSIERTLDAVFSTRVKGIVNNSVEVARSYLAESGQVIRSDMLGIARELEENAAAFRDDRPAFNRLFSAVVSMRNLPSAFLIDSSGKSFGIGRKRRLGLPGAPAAGHRARSRRPDRPLKLGFVERSGCAEEIASPQRCLPLRHPAR